MKTTTKEIIEAIGTVLLLMFISGLAGYYFSPTKTIIKEPEVKIIIEEVSILAESRRCKKWGGEFHIQEAHSQELYLYPEEPQYKISCAKTTIKWVNKTSKNVIIKDLNFDGLIKQETKETLFDYTFKI